MERPLQSTTRYTIKLSKQPSFYDCGTLLEFYQPIIGPMACSLYMTFFHDIKNNISIEVRSNHAKIFSTMQINKKDFIKGIKLLESLSLMKTYYKKIGKDVLYIYELIPPMSHQELFNNELFMEVINIKLDKNDIKYLTAKWNTFIKDKDAIDISEKFNSVNNFSLTRNESYSKNTHLQVQFNENLLQGFLDQYKINYKDFDSKDCDIIKVLFAAYDLEYYKFALLINKVTSNKKINIDKFRLIVQKEYQDIIINTSELNLIYTKDVNTMISDNSKLSKKISLMASKTPNNFLRDRLDRKPLSNELLLMETIMNTYQINSTTMNILIDFSLFKNGKLVFPYIEKIAKTLKDKSYTNPVDIIAYLIEADKISKNKKFGKIVSNKKKTSFPEKNIPNIKVSDEELDVIWKGFIDE